MKKDKKQLKLNIKGQFKNLLSTWLVNWRLRRMGVDVHDVTSVSPNHIQIHVSGQKTDLWQVINWSKRSAVFFSLNEVIFEFAD
jgi:hypothetical protein